MAKLVRIFVFQYKNVNKNYIKYKLTSLNFALARLKQALVTNSYTGLSHKLLNKLLPRTWHCQQDMEIWIKICTLVRVVKDLFGVTYFYFRY